MNSKMTVKKHIVMLLLLFFAAFYCQVSSSLASVFSSPDSQSKDDLFSETDINNSFLETAENCISIKNMEKLAVLISNSGSEKFISLFDRLTVGDVVTLLPKINSVDAAEILYSLDTEDAVTVLENVTSDVAANALTSLNIEKKKLNLVTELVSKMNSEARPAVLAKIPVLTDAGIIGSANIDIRVELLEELPRSKAIEVLNCFEQEFAIKFLKETNHRLTAFYINQADFEFAKKILDSRTKTDAANILSDMDYDLAVSYLWGKTESDRNILISQIGSSDLNRHFVQSGDILQFGAYPYEKNGSSKAITWIVLNTDYGNILMVSEKALDCQPYNSKKTNVRWSSSSIRQWLNNTFYKKAFSYEDQKKSIIVQNLDGSNNEDKVFLLSIKETETYLSLLDKTSAEPSPYASKNGASTGFLSSNTKWWLRNSGSNNSAKAAAVHPNGKIDKVGEDVNQTNRGVRPAIVVDYSYFSGLTSNQTKCINCDTMMREYENGAAAIKDDNYITAKNNYESVSGYLDIDDLYSAYLTEKFQKISDLGDHKRYDEAIELLNGMTGSYDASILKQFYLNQKQYESALASVAMDDYPTASETLKAIIDFKDSSFILESYRILRMRMADHFASVEDFDSAITVSSIMTDYEPAVEATQNYTNWKNYRLAESAISKDDYTAAAEILISLGDFEDSEEKLLAYQTERITRAKDASDLKAYEKAYEILNVMAGVKEADEALHEIKQMELYDQFHFSIAQSNYDEVLKLAEDLDRDVSSEITDFQNDLIMRAQDLAENKDYSGAYEILEMMTGVDSADVALENIKKADLYDQLIAAINYNDYSSAQMIYLKIPTYKNSTTLFTIFGASRISSANKFAEEKNYEKAYALLRPMGADQDADLVLADIEKQEKYDIALMAVAGDQYLKAESLLTELNGYLDSTQQLENYKTSRVERAKEAAENKNYFWAYALLQPMTGFVLADQAMSSIKISDNYDQALIAIENDEYETAASILTEISSYSDSAVQLKNYQASRVAAAKKAAEELDFEKAYEILTPMEGVTAADNAMSAIRKDDNYYQCIAAIEANDYEKAASLFGDLTGYKDIATKMFYFRMGRVADARSLAGEKKYQEAYDLLNPMSDYPDAVYALTEVQKADQYDQGLAAIEKDDYELASALMSGLTGYKDVYQKMLAYQTSRINVAKELDANGHRTEAYQILEIMDDSPEAVRIYTQMKNEDQYAVAMKAIQDDDYELADSTLTGIATYKDSIYQLNTYRTSRIAAARTAASEKRYQDAYDILTVMAGYYEADRALTDIQNADKYDQAMTLIGKDDYSNAIALLNEIRTYKDSANQIYLYQTSRINRAKALAAENNYSEAYSLLEEMDDYSQASLVLTDLQNQEKYSNGIAAIESDDYALALSILSALNYKDSSSKLLTYRTSRINNAKNLAAEGNYSQAYALLAEMSEYPEAVRVDETLHKDEQYSKAMAFIEVEDFISAKAILQELGTHKNSNSQLYTMRANCRSLSVEKIKAGNYDFAVNNVSVFDNTNFIALLNSVTAEEAKNYLVKLKTGGKLSDIFNGLDTSGKLRMLTLLGTDNAASFLKSIPPEDTAVLLRAMTAQSAALYLSSMDNPSAIAVLDSMDKSTANYYITNMSSEESSSLMKAMTAANQAAYFGSMTNYSISNIVKNWTEKDREAVFSTMDAQKTKDIYTLLNLPKIISIHKNSYDLKENGQQTISVTLSDKNLNLSDIKLVPSNDIVVKTSQPSLSDSTISFIAIAKAPGAVYFHFETKYGRVISDPILVSVIRNTPTPAPVFRYAGGGSGGYSSGSDSYSSNSGVSSYSNNYSNSNNNNNYSNSNSNSYSNSYAPSSGYNGQTVYITKTGKRYHYDPQCGGSGSWATTLDDARAQGLTPCQKCVH